MTVEQWFDEEVSALEQEVREGVEEYGLPPYDLPSFDSLTVGWESWDES